MIGAGKDKKSRTSPWGGKIGPCSGYRQAKKRKKGGENKNRRAEGARLRKKRGGGDRSAERSRGQGKGERAASGSKKMPKRDLNKNAPKKDKNSLLSWAAGREKTGRPGRTEGSTTSGLHGTGMITGEKKSVWNSAGGQTNFGVGSKKRKENGLLGGKAVRCDEGQGGGGCRGRLGGGGGGRSQLASRRETTGSSCSASKQDIAGDMTPHSEPW